MAQTAPAAAPAAKAAAPASNTAATASNAASPEKALAPPGVDTAPASTPGVAPPTAATPGAGAAAVTKPTTGAAQPATSTGGIEEYAPTPGIGQPDGRYGTQDQFTPIGHEAADFHTYWLMPLISIICIFVLALLIYVLVRFRRGAHPVPSRTSHNTTLEVVWTLLPVLILVTIAVPSIRLLRHQYSPPPADLTVKVIGNQWFWTYQYPDNGGIELVSNMLKEKDQVKAGERFRTDRDGPKLLAADERLVIPAGKVVKFIITSNDVIHSFAMPSFWMKLDAVPGRLNETWVKVDRPGVYFGQCSQLCGARHGFMPIDIQVVPPADFARWVASKGGTMPGAKPALKPDSTAATTVTPTSVPAAAQPTPAATNAALPAGVTPAKQTTAPTQGVPNNN